MGRSIVIFGKLEMCNVLACVTRGTDDPRMARACLLYINSPSLRLKFDFCKSHALNIKF